MTRNERTSKRVASTAGKLLAAHKRFMKDFDRLRDRAFKMRRQIASVAGSALTQVRDK